MANPALQQPTTRAAHVNKLDPVLSTESPVYRDASTGQVLLSVPVMTMEELFRAFDEPGVVPEDFLSERGVDLPALRDSLV